jgi:hypothetical protein
MRRWSLCVQMALIAVPAVELLLAGLIMMTQTKRGTLDLQVGGLGVGLLAPRKT